MAVMRNQGLRKQRMGKDIEIKSNRKLKSIPSIETQPYPGFPTDLQNQILAMQTITKGTSVVVENLY